MDDGKWAEAKDAFIGYALDRSEFFQPKEYTEDRRLLLESPFAISDLIREILEFDDSLLDILSGNGQEYFLVIANPSARGFLNKGGFSDILQNEEREWKNLFRSIHQNSPHLLANPLMATRKLDQGYVKKDWRYYLFVIMATLAFGYALIDLIFGI